jgi:hypothetical protein
VIDVIRKTKKPGGPVRYDVVLYDIDQNGTTMTWYVYSEEGAQRHATDLRVQHPGKKVEIRVGA